MSSTDETSDSNELERAAGQIEAPLASLVGDYEESQSDSPTEAKGIFLLPNLFTSGALFCGFYSIIAGMQGDFYAGAVAILVAMVFDGLDGRVARLTGTNSAFGAQYDSLADMVSFGAAPALLTFNWALTGLGKVGWVAAFIGLLYALTFVFAWGFFDRTHGHFHILMLLFLAAMVGFCFTRDMFNLFVWFEVMSVAAFALTAYHLAESSLAGAINFTVVNSLAGFLMLGGIGLIYAQTGTLDFEGIAAAVARGGRDPVVAGAFCLVASALMIKGAIVPFQFWLADAHAVAPSPVSVIFSGAMVSLGLFGLAKVSAVVFGGSDQVRHALPALIIGLGSFTALLGGWMALLQRHLKRMLAFSTISHAGIMLTGLGALSVNGTGGMLVYVVGHGLVKGALFVIAGILLAAVFAVLGVLPLITLTQIGIIVCIGVLLDTLLVRTVIVPALAFLTGERFWWPGRAISAELKVVPSSATTRIGGDPRGAAAD